MFARGAVCLGLSRSGSKCGGMLTLWRASLRLGQLVDLAYRSVWAQLLVPDADGRGLYHVGRAASFPHHGKVLRLGRQGGGSGLQWRADGCHQGESTAFIRAYSEGRVRRRAAR